MERTLERLAQVTLYAYPTVWILACVGVWLFDWKGILVYVVVPGVPLLLVSAVAFLIGLADFKPVPGFVNAGYIVSMMVSAAIVWWGFQAAISV